MLGGGPVVLWEPTRCVHCALLLRIRGAECKRQTEELTVPERTDWQLQGPKDVALAAAEDHTARRTRAQHSNGEIVRVGPTSPSQVPKVPTSSQSPELAIAQNGKRQTATANSGPAASEHSERRRRLAAGPESREARAEGYPAEDDLEARAARGAHSGGGHVCLLHLLVAVLPVCTTEPLVRVLRRAHLRHTRVRASHHQLARLSKQPHQPVDIHDGTRALRSRDPTHSYSIRLTPTHFTQYEY